MKSSEKAFTLVETLIATAVVGVLAAIAIPSYNYYINRAQVSEGFRLMDAQRANINKIQKNKSCTLVDGVADTYKGKYGILTVSGTYTPSTGLSCPTGCNAVYTLNGAGVSKGIAGTVVVAQILNNGKLSKNVSATTVPDKYLPTEFKTIGVSPGDVCSKITDDPLVPTGGSLPIGTDTGEVAPPTPTDPTNPTNPTDPTNPTNPTDPTNPTNPDDPTNPTGSQNDPLVLHVNNKYQSSNAVSDNYYVKSSINVYDDIVNVLKKIPTSNMSLTIIVYPDVAVVGNNTQTPALNFDSRLPSDMKILVQNNGYILGRGGDGAQSVKPGILYNPDASSSAQQKVYRNEGRSGTIYQDLLPIYVANYPFPSNIIPGVNVHFDEELTYRVDDWYLTGTSASNDGGDAIKLNNNVKVNIENKGVIAGGGGGGFALYDFENGQDSAADAESGSGGAPFGKTPQSSRQNASLFNVDVVQSYSGAGKGGGIGQNGAQISSSSMTNRNKYHKAGCAFSSTGLRVKNIGSSARVLGNANCPTYTSF